MVHVCVGLASILIVVFATTFVNVRRCTAVNDSLVILLRYANTNKNVTPHQQNLIHVIVSPFPPRPPLPHQFYTCKFCNRDDFKSAVGRDRHEVKCSEKPDLSSDISSRSKSSPPSFKLDPPSVIKGQTQTHSASAGSASHNIPSSPTSTYPSFEKRARIKLPTPSDSVAWDSLNTHLKAKLTKFTAKQLQSTNLNDFTNTFTDTVYQSLVEKCGIMPARKPKPKQTNRPKKSHTLKK